MVLKYRNKALGYPIILGRPWAATTTTLIDRRSDSMTISNGQRQKELTLYSLAKPAFHSDTQYWVGYKMDSERDGVAKLSMVAFFGTC